MKLLTTLKQIEVSSVIFLYRTFGITVFPLRLEVQISKDLNLFIGSCNALDIFVSNESLTDTLSIVTNKIFTYIKDNNLGDIQLKLKIGVDSKLFNEVELDEINGIFDKITHSVLKS